MVKQKKHGAREINPGRSGPIASAPSVAAFANPASKNAIGARTRTGINVTASAPAAISSAPPTPFIHATSAPLTP